MAVCYQLVSTGSTPSGCNTVLLNSSPLPSAYVVGRLPRGAAPPAPCGAPPAAAPLWGGLRTRPAATRVQGSEKFSCLVFKGGAARETGRSCPCPVLWEGVKIERWGSVSISASAYKRRDVSPAHYASSAAPHGIPSGNASNHALEAGEGQTWPPCHTFSRVRTYPPALDQRAIQRRPLTAGRVDQTRTFRFWLRGKIKPPLYAAATCFELTTNWYIFPISALCTYQKGRP